jgi:pimeloyl-ACP methyl ester carboxylesterase
MTHLGHKIFGEGPQRVFVLHDWMGDHTNYDPVLDYLDGKAFTYVFADLRGYGLSRAIAGAHSLEESVSDVVALANHLGWPSFHLLGHSMSSLVAQQVAVHGDEKIASLALIAPVVPGGMNTPESIIGFLEKLALEEDTRKEAVAAEVGVRLSRRWLSWKMQRWSQAVEPEVAKAYIPLFSRGVLTGEPRKDLPVFALVGDCDQEPFTEDTVKKGMAMYQNLELFVCRNAGHYPMQETPPAFASAVERFFLANPHPVG